MYITINGIKGEKIIDLSYSIQNFDTTARWGEASMERLGALPRAPMGPLGTHSVEIAVIRMLSDNVQYHILKLCSVMGPVGAPWILFQTQKR